MGARPTQKHAIFALNPIPRPGELQEPLIAEGDVLAEWLTTGGDVIAGLLPPSKNGGQDDGA